MTDLDTFVEGGDGEFLQQGPYTGDLTGPIGKAICCFTIEEGNSRGDNDRIKTVFS